MHESKVEDLCQRFVKLIVQQKVGNGLEDGTTFGPINNKMQYDRVTELLNDAVTHGGQGKHKYMFICVYIYICACFSYFVEYIMVSRHIL